METPELIESALQSSMTYQAYYELMEKLVAEGKTTGENQSPEFAAYTAMNFQRMRRLHKTAYLNPELAAAAADLGRKPGFLVISEAWCGDAAQNLPVLNMVAHAAHGATLRVVLRDEHPELMNRFLTNGGKSIPKLIVFDPESYEVLGTWGPRPEPAQQMVLEYKSRPEKEPYTEFVKAVQLWYAKDKTQTQQQELTQFLKGIKSLAPA